MSGGGLNLFAPPWPTGHNRREIRRVESKSAILMSQLTHPYLNKFNAITWYDHRHSVFCFQSTVIIITISKWPTLASARRWVGER